MAAIVSLGGQSTFNMHHGFVEAVVRGFRSGFIEDDTYHHLSQCETLEVLLFWFALFLPSFFLLKCMIRILS